MGKLTRRSFIGTGLATAGAGFVPHSAQADDLTYPAKAVTIVAAIELGRRRKDIDPEEKPRISGSKDGFEQIKADLMDLPHEEFWVILLNRANRMIKKKRVRKYGR